MILPLVAKCGAWRVFSVGCEILGHPPTWDITRRQMDEIEQIIRLQQASLMNDFEIGVLPK
jgi:hypothetical protein